MMSNNVRNYNCGFSDYAKHKFQSWDFWIKFKIANPFDADIIKRILRKKSTDSRILDYEKIKHICMERIRQFENNENVFSLKYNEPEDVTLNEMLEDYDLTEDDVQMIMKILYPSENRISDYEYIIKLCEKRINTLKGE